MPTAIKPITTQETTVMQPASLFAIWAEENNALNNNTYEWAFGNGANTPNNGGIVLPFDCDLVAMSLCLGYGAGSATVRIEKNGALQTGYEVICTSQRHNYINFSTALRFNAGDVLNFKTITAASTRNPNTVAAFLTTV